MKIYIDKNGTAPSPRRVRIYLAEKRIEVPYERLEIHKENRTPEFRKKNPISTLPVLELDDGTCISESIAICRYFEELHPAPTLFGSTPLEKAEIDMWMRRAELYVYIPIDMSGPDFLGAEAAEKFRGFANRAMRFLDRELADREFIAGKGYTIADIFAFGAIDYGIEVTGRFEIAPEQKNLERWYLAAAARPSARA